MDNAYTANELMEKKHIIKDTERTVTELPMIALLGICAFPHNIIQLDIGRKKSVNALNKAIDDKTKIFVATQIEEDGALTTDNIYTTGVIIDIKQFIRMPNNTYRLIGFGLKKAKAIEYIDKPDFITAKVVEEDDVYIDSIESSVLFDTCKTTLKKYLKLASVNVEAIDPTNEDSPEIFCNNVGQNIIKGIVNKQKLLEISDVSAKLEFILPKLYLMYDRVLIESEIMDKVKKNIDQSQREYYLREQVKVIHETLGDDMGEYDELRKRINALKISDTSITKLLKEVDKLSKMPSQAPEYSITKNYLDWVLDLPWDKKTSDRKDLIKAGEILEEDHYGLDEVKQRILEYIAVFKLTKNFKAPILCFVGPPGVGKTSIATSIARALNKNFTRMSLGGVKDESEIRGHRRTYVGAMPGRIIYNMKQANSSNPIFLLDEIDKMSSDFRGDPASALLEVLDPEQNNNFRDHYIELPFDLSKVMFIATANSVNTIQPPLLDRMELIEINGYTDEEKFEIAKRYLVPKAIKNTGLSKVGIDITDDAINEIITNYTSEAGVRALEKCINSICRKTAKNHITNTNGGLKDVIVDKDALKDILGAPKYKRDYINKSDEVGLVTGLAWTSVGGTVLPIEVSTMKGTGEIILTGQLGDVMKESAKTALGYIKSNSKLYNIDEDNFDKMDIHIHAPEGAVPKDGPSAGITIATALLSALIGKKVNHNIAMTGEVTLLGNVLPIGGLKEKSLAAYREGISTIIIPKANESDIKDLPKSVKDKLEFVLVEKVQQVFDRAMIN